MQLTDTDIKWLLQNNITTIIDLRSLEEYTDKKCPLELNTDFCYIHLPVTGGNRVPLTKEDVVASYVSMVDMQMGRIITAIEQALSNVLFFCNAGKDRTGVVSAILLARMGADDQYIIENYLESAVNLDDMLNNYIRSHTERDYSMIIPKYEYMEQFLMKWHTLQNPLCY